MSRIHQISDVAVVRQRLVLLIERCFAILKQTIQVTDFGVQRLGTRGVSADCCAKDSIFCCNSCELDWAALSLCMFAASILAFLSRWRTNHSRNTKL